jgi:hypothetical protein
MRGYEELVGTDTDFLAYLRSKFPMYHLCTFFFRDVQFGVADLLRGKGVHVRGDQAEKVARVFVARLEKARLFIPIDRQTWAVNVPDFRTPQVKPAVKPAATPAATPASTPVAQATAMPPAAQATAAPAGA